MSEILNCNFDGPHDINSNFNQVAGVYLLHDGEKWIDVGETENLKDRILNHERKKCWQRNAGLKPIKLEFLSETNQQKRLLIEQELRRRLKPTCGDR